MSPLVAPLLLLWLSCLPPRVSCSSSRERFKVMIAPVCKRICVHDQCLYTCEQGSNSTLIAANGQAADVLVGPGFTVVVCPLTCLNGGVCSSRKHCRCPPGFTGRLCQSPVPQQVQAARGNKQPVYPVSLKPDSPKVPERSSLGRAGPQLTQTHMITIPLSQAGHHSSEVQVNLRVLHTPDTSVHIQPQDPLDLKPPLKMPARASLARHKPKGRCFQETTPKQACNSTPLPVLTNQEDCCGSVGNSWGQNKCFQCPKLPNPSVKQGIVEDSGSTCPQGYKRFNSTHCQDINECSLQGVCQNGYCLNTLGSFKCSCNDGLVLERNRCVEPPAEQAQCFRRVSDQNVCEQPVPTLISQKLCCCTVGLAWGSDCQRCPQEGTVAFAQICPAGKGYSIQTRIVSFPPFFLPLKPDQEESKPAQRPVETTTAVQQLPRSPSSRVPVVKPTPPTILRIPPNNDPLETQITISDDDECGLSRNICGHGECENSPNGHICHCHLGYHFNLQTNICEDDNECDSDPCGHGRGHCVNLDGSYKCLCRPGYKHMVQHGRLKCIDVNECSKPDICGAGGHCVNLPGSYKCECHSGYKSKSHRHALCEDINECLHSDACPNQQCENTPGSYECIPCLPGHEARAGVCYDINECQTPGICPNGRCENLPGTYRCLCNEGFLPLADSKGCRDVDECEDVRLCANGRCINTEGSFQCQCYPGYRRTQEGSHCEDINECEKLLSCQRGRCINKMGSYHCECPKGYALVGGRRCQDVDECAADRNLCQPFGSCENRPGSYVCACRHGYALSEDKHSCEVQVQMEEKKECYLNLDDTVFCDSVLATNVTKQECCCSIGVGWGDHCEIYPCPVSHSVEFISLCPSGQGLYTDRRQLYSLAAYKDIDECSLFSDEICKKGRCENTLPGYECYCQQGFYYDSNLLECIDVNECHDESLCTNGHCVNTDGSFFCNCPLPWTPDASRKSCVITTLADVNECDDASNCKNGLCVDIPGSYYCICSPPWTLAIDRNSCVTPEEQADVNECQDPSYCKNGRCENTPGSFHCFCDLPLTFSAALKQCVYDDRTAAHKDVCFLQVVEGLICSEPQNGLVVTYSECCCHYGRGWGPECNTCPSRNSEMFTRLCEMHLETESDGDQESLAAFVNYNPGDSSEEDSDECSCANGRCVRSYLGTMCECNPGFRLDHSRSRCVDLDECKESGLRSGPCKNAHCVNTVGSFMCYCKHGFTATRNPNICIRRRAR
ncbi:latent-transforming growth factor beta-binding protein 3 isoform X2 [Synchiropus splendidus]|uniref:latent-transforming growth factor beta-binding protein 3 isoform X2 n=1 Tax=Synchiropus splendidus TaxID=270530 RepID=UPI00237D967D|nr:latent-transforming growth factor beta-binding protein 3 isoform X2 [Synchiropus splendidus]